MLVHDDWARPHELDVVAPRVELTAELLADADAVVIVTDHDDTDYALISERASYVLDCRRRITDGSAELL